MKFISPKNFVHFAQNFEILRPKKLGHLTQSVFTFGRGTFRHNFEKCPTLAIWILNSFTQKCDVNTGLKKKNCQSRAFVRIAVQSSLLKLKFRKTVDFELFISPQKIISSHPKCKFSLGEAWVMRARGQSLARVSEF